MDPEFQSSAPPPPPVPVLSPPAPQPSSAPAGRPVSLVWGFWATLGFGTAVAGAMVAVQTFVVIAFAAFSVAMGHHPTAAALTSDGLLLSVATCCSAPVVVGLSVLFASLRRGLPVKEYLALKPVTFRALAWSFAALLATYVCWAAVVRVFDLPQTPQFMLDAYRTAKFRPLLWLALVLAGPAGEECLFRGFLFQGLTHSRAGPAGAILLTSAPWALIHVQYGPVEIAFIFLLGVILGCIRLKTGSLWAPFLIHAASNLIATVELALSSD